MSGGVTTLCCCGEPIGAWVHAQCLVYWPPLFFYADGSGWVENPDAHQFSPVFR